MNKILYILILLTFSLPSIYSQTREEKPKWAPRKEKHRNTTDPKGKQGLWKYFNYDKKLLMEVEFENDMRNGTTTRYNVATGGIKEEQNYYYNVKEGEYKSYNYTGTIKSEGQFKKNKRDGLWIFYHTSTGEKSTEGNYISGKKNGEWTYYNRKGELYSRGMFKNDVKTGIWRYYDGNGNEVRKEGTDAPVKPKEIANKPKVKKIIPIKQKSLYLKSPQISTPQPVPQASPDDSTSTSKVKINISPKQ